MFSVKGREQEEKKKRMREKCKKQQDIEREIWKENKKSLKKREGRSQ